MAVAVVYNIHTVTWGAANQQVPTTSQLLQAIYTHCWGGGEGKRKGERHCIYNKHAYWG